MIYLTIYLNKLIPKKPCGFSWTSLGYSIIKERNIIRIWDNMKFTLQCISEGLI